MFKSNRILTIDVGASNVRFGVFSALRSGGIELVDFSIEPLVSGASASDGYTHLTMALRNLMREHHIKPGPVSVSVSGQQVFSKFVRLPPVAEDKVEQIVKYEAQQNVPFPINEVVWDYQLIGGVEGEVDVMLAAIKTDISEGVCRAIMEAGLDPKMVDVAPLALYNAVRYNYDKLPPCTLVVDIGARSTDLIFIEQGRLFNRSIPVGGNTITREVMKQFDQEFEDAEDIKISHGFVSLGGAYEAPTSEVADKVSKSVRSVMTRLHAEIGRSINFYRTQQEGTGPGLILLTGGSSVLPYMDVFLEEKLGAKVEFLNPFQNVSVGGTIPDEKIAASAHLLGEIVGTSLRDMMTCPIEINLLPASVKAEQEMKKKIPVFIAAAFCVGLIVAIWCVYFLQMSRIASERYEVVSSKVNTLRNIERQMVDLEQDISEIQNRYTELIGLARDKSQWIEILQAIHKQLPDAMWITNLSLHSGEEGERARPAAVRGRQATPEVEVDHSDTGSSAVIRIEGRGYVDVHDSGQSVNQLVQRLRAHDLFLESTEVTWLPTPGSDDHVRRFRIDIVLDKSVAI